MVDRPIELAPHATLYVNHRDVLLRYASENEPVSTIARKLYFLAPSAAFAGRYERQLALYETICEKFGTPLSAIRLVGSAHTGFSLVKDTPFDSALSDLDIAIVDSRLYLSLFEEAFVLTNQWRDVSKFSSGQSANGIRDSFLHYLRRGIIRPDLLPASPRKAEWTNFFGRLSDKYTHFCKGITAGVYASETFMAVKQESAIEKFLAKNLPNDQI